MSSVASFKISYNLDAEDLPNKFDAQDYVLDEFHSKTISGDADWPTVVLELVRFLRSVYYITVEDENRIDKVMEEIMEDKMKAPTSNEDETIYKQVSIS